MHALVSRLGAVANRSSTIAIVLAALISVSTVLFPADTQTRVELTNIKVTKGRPTYYATKKEEYAKINFDLDADLSSLFNWNTKQVFVYVLASYPSFYSSSSDPVATNATIESIIWDHIIPAPASPYSLASLQEGLAPWLEKLQSQPVVNPKSKKQSPRQKPGAQRSRQRIANSQSGGETSNGPSKPGILKLRNERPKYHITDLSGRLAERRNASLVVGWNVQPWVGQLLWSKGSNFGRHAGSRSIVDLTYLTDGKEGARSPPFDFPALPVPKARARSE